jgi:hypothetical protein
MPSTALLLVLAIAAAYVALASARPDQPLGAIAEDALTDSKTAAQAIDALDERLAAIVDPEYADDAGDATGAAEWWKTAAALSEPLVAHIAQRIADGACDSDLPAHEDARCLEAIAPLTLQQAATLLHLHAKHRAKEDAAVHTETGTAACRKHTTADGVQLALGVAAVVTAVGMGTWATMGCPRRWPGVVECTEAEHAALLAEQRARALAAKATKMRVRRSSKKQR